MSLCHYTYIYGIKLHNNGWSKEELECDEERGKEIRRKEKKRRSSIVV